MERSLSTDEKIGKTAQEFYMVRCADKTTAEKVKSVAPPSLIFFDGDGKEFHRVAMISPSDIDTHMKEALAKYSRKEIAWATGETDSAVSAAKLDKKLVAMTFVDDRKDSVTFLESLGDRWIAKHHDKVVFVKVPYEKDSPACKEYAVTSAPTLILVNPNEEDAKKKVIDRLVAKTQVASIRAFLLKAFAKNGK